MATSRGRSAEKALEFSEADNGDSRPGQVKVSSKLGEKDSLNRIFLFDLENGAKYARFACSRHCEMIFIGSAPGARPGC
jgi:hypothetical protein